FCMDNIPPLLITRFLDLYSMTQYVNRRVAMVVDARGGDTFQDLVGVLRQIDRETLPYKVLFLDADNEVLLHRYKESRRKHPLTTEQNQSLEQAIATERQLLQPIRETADYIIDTSMTPAAKLKGRIMEVFNQNGEQAMLVHCLSFGYKNGLPPEADLVFDVRCLPNPFYLPALREQTGLTQQVRDYVMDSPDTQGLLERLCELLDFLVPLYIQEGKSQLVVAVGCTGGKHRSVAVAEELAQHLRRQGRRISVSHRDMDKPNQS
ncbi:MAG: RNase adapter RapZ, partial [Angelakisella sp.]